MTDSFSIHPLVDGGVERGREGFSGSTLVCRCTADPVEVSVQSEFLYNHLCGCTQCWKPEGALFSILAAAPRERVRVASNEQKLAVVDPNKLLHRYACRDCGVHMYGVIEDLEHVFHDFAFIHPELSRDPGWNPPTFAAFVSSVIESGFPPSRMSELRSHLRELGLEPYDCYSPELMDIIAAHAARRAGVLQEG